MKKKSFSDLPARDRAAAMAALAVSVVLVTIAERDIQRRPPKAIRGNKLIWRVVSSNSLGALAYFGWGRRAS